MTFSTFEYSLAFISIILIITIIVIIFYKKTEDDDETDNRNSNISGKISGNISGNISDNQDSYLKVNMEHNNMEHNNMEHFESRYVESNINDIYTNNSSISDLINSISNIASNNPSVNMKYRTKDIDNSLQDNIAASLTQRTDDLINRVDTSNVRINDKITTLTNQITDLENIIERLNLKSLIKPNYTTIKSLNNGAEMTLTQTPNTFFLDPGSGVNTAAYMVNLNNGCLSVGATDYDVYKCNELNSKHLFKMEHVINETAYQKHIDKTVPFNNTDISTINYPFVLMRSVNNKNCLTNQNGNITVQPCDTLTAQRWLPE